MSNAQPVANQPMTQEQMEQALREMQATVQQQAATINKLQGSIRNLGRNLKFLRDLVNECVHLTEQTSGIVVEHVSTLDKRLDSVGTIFTDKIKRQLKELDESVLVDAVITQVDKDEE